MKVGDKVVCIEENWISASGFKYTHLPIKRRIYAIHAIQDDGYLQLVEFPPLPIMGFNPAKFRPLTFGEQETEIVLEHFRKEEEKELIPASIL
jgi:hypothetical protein